MKVLMISGDSLALNPESGVHRRLRLQASQVGFLTVFVPLKGRSLPGNPQISLDNRGIVRGFPGNKLQIAWGMLKSAKREQFDIITAQDPLFLGHIAWHIARRLKIKIQFQIHTDLFSDAFAKHSLGNRIKAQWALFHLRRANCIRVVSERIKDSLIEKGIVAPISVLPIFVDLEKFRAVERQPHTDKNILWIGRFEPEKNPLQAITVFQEVLNAEPGTKLIMLGEGSLKAVLIERSKAFSSGQISFAGWADPRDYFKTANIVLSTSLHESWGASIVEALAAGIPVVAPDVGIAREAGTIIASRADLAKSVIAVLKSGQGGTLQLRLPDADEWAGQWYAGLVQCCETPRRVP